jgi:hypothetical protein
MVVCVTGGWSSEAEDQIAAALEMSKDAIARTGIDLDICDSARWLIDKGVDLNDRAAVERAPGPTRDTRFREAVLIAALNMSLSVEEWSPSQGVDDRCDRDKRDIT